MQIVAVATLVVEVTESLLDLVAPRACAGCAAPGYLLCPACRSVLAVPARRTSPRPAPVGFPQTWCLRDYDGVTRELLLAHKERGRLGLARPLGSSLARAVEGLLPASGSDPVVLVPVPSTRAATRARGHDPLLRTARHAARALRAEGRTASVLPLLVVGRVVADSAGLSARSRAANLAGAHVLRHRLATRVPSNAHVVLVDDLVTTGASLTEAARALSVGGLPPLGAAVVASTVRRLDRPTGTG